MYTLFKIPDVFDHIFFNILSADSGWKSFYNFAFLCRDTYYITTRYLARQKYISITNCSKVKLLKSLKNTKVHMINCTFDNMLLLFAKKWGYDIEYTRCTQLSKDPHKTFHVDTYDPNLNDNICINYVLNEKSITCISLYFISPINQIILLSSIKHLDIGIVYFDCDLLRVINCLPKLESLIIHRLILGGYNTDKIATWLKDTTIQHVFIEHYAAYSSHSEYNLDMQRRIINELQDTVVNEKIINVNKYYKKELDKLYIREGKCIINYIRLGEFKEFLKKLHDINKILSLTAKQTHRIK